MSSIVISISGPSGVGKTTIAKMLFIVCGSTNALLLSDDDLHKWPRLDLNWKKFTHLDPAANNIQDGIEQTKKLKSGSAVSRTHYDHATGVFMDPVVIEPKKYIIREGLHTLYSNGKC